MYAEYLFEITDIFNTISILSKFICTYTQGFMPPVEFFFENIVCQSIVFNVLNNLYMYWSSPGPFPR